MRSLLRLREESLSLSSAAPTNLSPVWPLAQTEAVSLPGTLVVGSQYGRGVRDRILFLGFFAYGKLGWAEHCSLRQYCLSFMIVNT
jgi:hypothetical protein